MVLQTTPEGLVKGDELSPKMQAAGAVGGCYIDGQLQRASVGDSAAMQRLFGGCWRTSLARPDEPNFTMVRPVINKFSSTSNMNTYSYSCKVNLTAIIYFGL